MRHRRRSPPFNDVALWIKVVTSIQLDHDALEERRKFSNRPSRGIFGSFRLCRAALSSQFEINICIEFIFNLLVQQPAFNAYPEHGNLASFKVERVLLERPIAILPWLVLSGIRNPYSERFVNLTLALGKYTNTHDTAHICRYIPSHFY